MTITSVKRIHQSDWTSSGVRFLRARDIVSAAKNEEPTDYLYISEEKYKEYSLISGKVTIGDLLVTGVGSIGVPFLITNDNPVYFKDGNVIWFKNNNVIDGKFFYYSFIHRKIQKFINDVAGIGTVGTYTIDSGKKTPISLPIKKEQEKIGNLFKQLDDTIALHLCKQRQLELLKQRLIKEILPQSDSTLPHLRFANFRKPWEQHQLKEVLKVNSGRDYKHLNEGNIPVYGTGGYMLSVDGKLSDVDGIGLGRKGTIDKPQYLKAPFWTVDTLFYLTPSPNYDIYFLYTLIQNVNWKSMDESTGVPSLSKSVIERVTLTFPILEEQQKIGSFFREFDNTISLHQQKIAHLKALKSTILNKMFI